MKYNNKRVFEKIKRNMLNLNIEEGGLKMMNIENQKQMFLAKWREIISQFGHKQ